MTLFVKITKDRSAHVAVITRVSVNAEGVAIPDPNFRLVELSEPGAEAEVTIWGDLEVRISEKH